MECFMTQPMRHGDPNAALLDVKLMEKIAEKGMAKPTLVEVIGIANVVEKEFRCGRNRYWINRFVASDEDVNSLSCPPMHHRNMTRTKNQAREKKRMAVYTVHRAYTIQLVAWEIQRNVIKCVQTYIRTLDIRI